ncbi:peptide chain release factor 2 [Syntrophorhabdus aromaticivorans]|uniref:Peptide chain release factor 2 n=1 Tax=Syntrophorhabdus aromaticivorans TaxID=328301 RepID=A0A351U1V0_9BACT|nr:peptide chain release factor 2 [Syntrophorhabdus aromaticivorans]NLW36886.1 peptide chain release factor 2 [Syntrophorhabdus aromaticivorans]HBA53931.1 peptide chain release factor 2 [Syntrophorhabdus aromaticivorans]
MLDETKTRIDTLVERMAILRGYLDLPALEGQIRKLDSELSEQALWEDQEKAQKILKERSRLRGEIEDWTKKEKELEEVLILDEFARETEDQKDIEELETRVDSLDQALGRYEIERMLSGENDDANVIVYINAGAGGTEAQDWVEMLLRMYLKWAERKGFESQVVDLLPGEEAGVKNVTFLLKGPYAYGYLKCENGIHRLVRISPFDTNSRRHTSFASVYAYPEITDDIAVDIREEDIRIDTFRASGPGGQHVNRTDSAIRITHMPTGIVVQCQNERSQHKNKAIAMAILRSRIYELEKKKQEEKINSLNKEKKDIAWGSQIRSYILHPYKLIKDHRTKIEVHNAEGVLAGDIDAFIKAYLLYLTFEQKNDN